jgi:hypothetical protein
MWTSISIAASSTVPPTDAAIFKVSLNSFADLANHVHAAR